MKNLPLPIKIILNIFFFIVYYVLISFLSWMLLWVILVIVWNYSDEMIDKWSEIIGATTFFITLTTIYFRRYFYISFANADSEKPVEKPNEINSNIL